MTPCYVFTHEDMVVPRGYLAGPRSQEVDSQAELLGRMPALLVLLQLGAQGAGGLALGAF